MMRTPNLVRFVIAGSVVALAPAARADAPPTTAAVVRPPTGAHLIPYAGLNSFQGDTGKGDGPGFRFGGLAGGHITPMFSLNGEVTVDFINANSSSSTPGTGGTTMSTSVSGIELDLAASPLVHIPINNFEIVAGPKLGAFFAAANDSVDVAGMTIANKATAHGWLAGANVGGFVSLSQSVELGGLLSFVLRNPTTACDVATFGVNTCFTSGLTANKVLAFAVALLF